MGYVDKGKGGRGGGGRFRPGGLTFDLQAASEAGVEQRH